MKTLYKVVKEVCNAVCEEYVDEIMTAPPKPEELILLTYAGLFQQHLIDHCRFFAILI